MKKVWVIGIILLLIGVNVSVSFGKDSEIMNKSSVSYDRNILYVGGSGPNNYTMIQNAIDNASQGDSIFVYNGTYFENLVINKTIALIGEDKNTTAIDGNGTGHVVSIIADFVTIKEFTIRNCGGQVFDAGALIISNYNTIEKNYFTNNRNGIYLENSFNNTILENTLTNCSYSTYKGAGIRLKYSSYNNMSDNVIPNNDGIGIIVSYSDGCNSIYRNNITNNNDGILLLNGSNNTIHKNDIAHNNDDGIRVIESLNNSISGNTILDNGFYGIYMWFSFNTVISENTIANNSYMGIHIDYFSSHNKIKENFIANNSNGIEIEHYSFYNIVSGNFVTNTLHEGITVRDSNNNTIIENNITNHNEGIKLLNSLYNIISGNNINNNTDGIYINSCFNNIIFGNTMSHNIDHGLIIHSSSRENHIFHNNFFNNIENVMSHGYDNIWDDGYPSGGNYWDDYNGTDSDGDGIGDTPYPIPGGTSEDRYPFMGPDGWDINYPPSEILFSGPGFGKPGIDYTFYVEVYDRNEDDIYFKVDWGDGSYSDWLGPYHSGENKSIKHSWSIGTYNLRVKAKDVFGAVSNWSDPKLLIIEDSPPNVVITKPETALYFNNVRIRRFLFRRPLIFRDIDIEVNAFDDLSDIQRVDFYINGELKTNDTSSPYSFTWERGKRTIFRHRYIIEVVAFDNAGNSNHATMVVRRFL